MKPSAAQLRAIVTSLCAPRRVSAIGPQRPHDEVVTPCAHSHFADERASMQREAAG
jgi:hypothetical protein